MADPVHFPKMLYTAQGLTTIVASQAEQTALGPRWAESPMAFNIVTAPSAAQILAGAADPLAIAANARLLSADTLQPGDAVPPVDPVAPADPEPLADPGLPPVVT
jgi:hypothetical protein